MLLGGFLVGSPRLPHATAFRDFRYGHILLRVVGRHCQMRCAEGFLLTRSQAELPLPQIRPRAILPRNMRRASGLVQTPPFGKSDPRTNKGMLRAQSNSWRESRTSKNRADLSAGVGRAHVAQLTLALKTLFFWQFSGVFYKRITSLSLRERDGDESVVL